MGRRTGNDGGCDLCGSGGLLDSEKEAAEGLHSQETGGGVPVRSRYVCSCASHLDLAECGSLIAALITHTRVLTLVPVGYDFWEISRHIVNCLMD